MNINEELKIVLPIKTNADGETIVRGYHTPISREVFEENYRILASTKAEISKRGNYYRLNNGAAIASLTLRDEARKDSVENGTFDPKTGIGSDDAAIALFAELKRLTIIIAPTPNGYEQIPVDIAIQRGLIDSDEWKEAESALVFFTCFYALTKKAERKDMLIALTFILKASNTSLPPMDLIASLLESTKEETTDKKAESSAQSLPM